MVESIEVVHAEPERKAYVFGDISGDDATPVTVASAYLGTYNQWGTAVREWEAAVTDAGVEYFHATDFFGARKLFKSWEKGSAKHNEFAQRFSAIAADAGLVGFAYGVEPKPFRKILAPVFAKEQRRCKMSDIRVYMTAIVLTQISNFLARANHPDLNMIRVGFENEQGGGRYSDFFNESKHKRRESWTRWFEDFTLPDGSWVPCQVADLLAYESFKRLGNIVAKNDEPLRESFQRMLAREALEIRMLETEQLQRTADAYKNILAQYPNGIIPHDLDPSQFL